MQFQLDCADAVGHLANVDDLLHLAPRLRSFSWAGKEVSQVSRYHAVRAIRAMTGLTRLECRHASSACFALYQPDQPHPITANVQEIHLHSSMNVVTWAGLLGQLRPGCKITFEWGTGIVVEDMDDSQLAAVCSSVPAALRRLQLGMQSAQRGEFYPGTCIVRMASAAPAPAAATAVLGALQGLCPPFRSAGSSVEQLRAEVEQLQALSIANDIMFRLFDYDDGNATAMSVPQFKGKLMTAYSAQRAGRVGRLAFCMLTHKYLPTKSVIASHLWKRAWARFCDKVGIEDIDDVRNGLLLFKPIKWAFDNSKLSIVPNTTFHPTTFQAYLQDESLKDVRLVDKLEQLRHQGKVQVTDEELGHTCRELGSMTFGDVHQRGLQSDGTDAPRPFTRVLDFQYKRALRKAAQENWPRPEGSPPPSHASPGDWHVQRMFDSLQAADSQ